jgi:cell division protein FtsZ
MNPMTKIKKDVRTPLSYAVRIKVVGIGGGGGNAVSRMSSSMNVRGVEFIVINTDVQDLENCNVRKRILIGKNITRGLGTGMNPDLGRQAAEESRSEIVEALRGTDLVFFTAGLGGGTGSSGIQVLAEVAHELGVLTVAVVTKPFAFEGSHRNRIAQEALAKLKEKVDTLIVIPNDRVFSIIKKDTPLIRAFEYIDDVLHSAVEGISELIAMPGIINVDFADVRAIMKDGGTALVGVGIGTGQDRATAAVNHVINSPLLEVSIDGAKGVLFGIAGNRDLKMAEINEIAKIIAASVDPSAKIIFGAYHDRKLKAGQLKVTLIATGFSDQMIRGVESLPTLFTEATKLPKHMSDVKEHAEHLKKQKNAHASKALPDGEEKNSDIWEIPTFLRKRK